MSVVLGLGPWWTLLPCAVSLRKEEDCSTAKMYAVLSSVILLVNQYFSLEQLIMVVIHYIRKHLAFMDVTYIQYTVLNGFTDEK